MENPAESDKINSLVSEILVSKWMDFELDKSKQEPVVQQLRQTAQSIETNPLPSIREDQSALEDEVQSPSGVQDALDWEFDRQQQRLAELSIEETHVKYKLSSRSAIFPLDRD